MSDVEHGYAIQLRQARDQIRDLCTELEECKKVPTAREQLADGGIGLARRERDAARVKLVEAERDVADLMAYIDAAKIAAGSHRVTGQPLAEAVESMAEEIARLRERLEAAAGVSLPSAGTGQVPALAAATPPGPVLMLERGADGINRGVMRDVAAPEPSALWKCERCGEPTPQVHTHGSDVQCNPGWPCYWAGDAEPTICEKCTGKAPAATAEAGRVEGGADDGENAAGS